MPSRTFLVSGAGSGIGRAISQTLAKRGDKVILMGRTYSTLEETKALLEGDDHFIITADIGNRQKLQEAMSSCPPLHGAIANAGLGGENIYGDNDRWNEVIQTNLTGSYYFMHEAYQHLKDTEGYKHAIFMSSILARLGIPEYNAYCASKAGLLGLMRSLAAEWATNKILVNALCPGWVDTDMAAEGIEAYAKETGVSFDEAKAQQMSFVPLGKMSTPEEIADFVAYLTGDNQTSITGQSLDINNGALMPS